MTVKKAIGKLHLWLGLTSGPVVFIVAVTGCIYAFQEEIQDLTQSYRFVEAQNQPFLPPSKIREIADAVLPGKYVHGVLYEGPERAAKVIYFKANEYYDFVYVNQYTGEVLKVKDELSGFFRIILDGHFYLWLPHKVGQIVVASSTLIFVVMLITGIFLWWPRNKKSTKKSFKIKWNARWRRKNFDLHNVLGFYVSWIAVILALTGLVWGFEWFKNSIYAVTGGERSLVYQEPASKSSPRSTAVDNPVDMVWERVKQEYSHAESIEMHFPVTDQSPVLAEVNTDASTYWKMDYIYYDQYTFEEIPVHHIWSRLHEADFADKLMRMNYDIHVGAILGLPGKILAFFASLLVASLPVTGTIIWLGRRNKKKKEKGTNRTKKGRKKQAMPRVKVRVEEPVGI
ncbi:putative iron-regulated membrane protein [Fulvivirga imtechensis AK7]|uniref:Putative iron-regulated membrane protein n=1 Tax=Fulvivirga imtechensis AK7 TaxID=1237149 RepID=L8JQ33_9BACT|nr:PepSY-associated TM helix domain-containing protein [Fulvivirga imtechensis]ELR69492.1 putative iron-regulated membrane protein [Fulvivirga imtechensis AK7]